MIVGSAKSIASARAGHYYAHPSNRFWSLLQATGLTDGVLIAHTEDRDVLRFGIGLTDVVPDRAESNDAKLTPSDLDLPGLIAKLERIRPDVVAFNGGTSANGVSRYLGHGSMTFGPAEWRVAGAAAYRLPSSSARHATGGYEAKRTAWVEFGEWARSRIDSVPQS